MTRYLIGATLALILTVLVGCGGANSKMLLGLELKDGTTFPTYVLEGSTTTAYFTVTNQTQMTLRDVFIKSLPSHVTQVTTGGTYDDTCGATATLSPDQSCTLQLTISGIVSTTDRIVACLRGGINCEAAHPSSAIIMDTLEALTVTGSSDPLMVDDTLQLTATASLASGATTDVTSSASWESSDTSVATVDEKGLITAVAAGISTITATYNGLSSTKDVTVATQSPELTAVTVTSASATATVGATTQLTATALYSDDTTSDVTTQATWSSSNTSVATIGATTGLVTGVSAGTATITATYGSSSNSKSGTTAIIIVAPQRTLSAITITPASATASYDYVTHPTQQFTATATYSDASTADITSSVTWSSSDTSTATISASGLATVQMFGTTSITATLGGITSNPVPYIILQSI